MEIEVYQTKDLYDILNIQNVVKEEWEDQLARNIMKSIGCHRLRGEKDKFSYWDSSNNKCIKVPKE